MAKAGKKSVTIRMLLVSVFFFLNRMTFLCSHIECKFLFFPLKVMHGKEKMCHGCITPGCPAEVATKVVDGKVMAKNTNPNHSSECVKIHDEKYGKSKAIESVNRKRPKPKRTSAKKKDSDSEGSSKSSGDDVPKKQMKKADDKSSAKSVENSDSESIDTKVPESGGAPAMDKEQVGKNRCCTWDESGTSDSSLDSTDSSSDDDSTDSISSGAN